MAYQMKLNLQKIKDSYMEVQINAPLFFCHNLCWRFSVQFQICCLIGLAEFCCSLWWQFASIFVQIQVLQWLKFCVLPCDREVFLLILSWFLMAASALFHMCTVCSLSKPAATQQLFELASVAQPAWDRTMDPMTGAQSWLSSRRTQS